MFDNITGQNAAEDAALTAVNDNAAELVRELARMLEAARTIRDRSGAAIVRGLRQDDFRAMDIALSAVLTGYDQAAAETVIIGAMLHKLAD